MTDNDRILDLFEELELVLQHKMTNAISSLKEAEGKLALLLTLKEKLIAEQTLPSFDVTLEDVVQATAVSENDDLPF